jgi:two-component system, response regulator PdtaR
MPSQRSLRIAIAEDEFFLAEDLRQLVEASGHEVVGVVATAPELVALVQRWRPDLALVDIQLARGSNGLDAAKAIKQQHGVPAIAVTANPDEERARKAGVLGLVPKPHASAVLAAVLRATAEWLEKGRVQENSSRLLFVGR